MKKIILSLIVVFAAIAVSAQNPNVGRVGLGAIVSASGITTTNSTGTKETTSNFAISPGVYYQVSEKLQLGVGAGYRYAKKESQSISANLRGKYSFFQVKSLSLNLLAELGYNNVNYEAPARKDYNKYVFNVYPSISYAMGHWEFELTSDLLSFSLEYLKYSDNASRFNFDGQISSRDGGVNIGAIYFF